MFGIPATLEFPVPQFHLGNAIPDHSRPCPTPHQGFAETLQATFTTPAANFRYATRAEPGMAMAMATHSLEQPDCANA